MNKSGHGPMKDASLECIQKEWKNEINESTDSRPRYKAQKLTIWIDCGLFDCWNCPKQLRWDNTQIWWNGKDKGSGRVLFNITITPCVWRDQMKSQNLLRMANIPIQYLPNTSYAATANLFGTYTLLLQVLN